MESRFFFVPGGNTCIISKDVCFGDIYAQKVTSFSVHFILLFIVVFYWLIIRLLKTLTAPYMGSLGSLGFIPGNSGHKVMGGTGCQLITQSHTR